MKEIFVDIKHCLACRTCEIVCAVAHSVSKDLFSAIREDPLPVPRVKVKTSRTAKAVPLQCHHCNHPHCIPSCERGAIRKDPATMLTIIDSTLCAGCSTLHCASACPFGAIIVEKEKKIVLLCDQCIDFGEPVCIKGCPTKVFSLERQFAALK